MDPNSGIEGSCGTVPDGSVYDGVRGGREYYEPDASDGQDGPGYSPRQEQNEAEAQRSSQVRDFPGLFERMNEPFLPTGFGDVPWYGIFGNHDGLVQGNQNRNAALDAIATGCVKVTGLGGRPPSAAGALDALVATAAGGDPALTRTVPQDPRRHLLFKREYIAQHFVTSGTPAGHGFTADDSRAGRATTPSARGTACASWCSTPSRTPAATAATSTTSSSAGSTASCSAADAARRARCSSSPTTRWRR